MNPEEPTKKPLPEFPSPDAWTEAWEAHWREAGLSSYELPPSDEGDFLSQIRSPEKERSRLDRITNEFESAFLTFGDVGPAVTVFGSARFKETHPHYQLARGVGRELAKAGFGTLTGGGPGIMEAANRGAHEAGGKSYGLNIILPREDGLKDTDYETNENTHGTDNSCRFVIAA